MDDRAWWTLTLEPNQTFKTDGDWMVDHSQGDGRQVLSVPCGQEVRVLGQASDGTSYSISIIGTAEAPTSTAYVKTGQAIRDSSEVWGIDMGEDWIKRMSR